MKKYFGKQTGKSIDENVELARTSLQDVIIKTKIESNNSNNEFAVDVNSDEANNIKEIELVFKVPFNNNEDKELIVDDQLSLTSINPIQNKVITEELNKKGTYSKPNTGIPKNDLSSDIQTSLNKANTALQKHQDISGKVDKIEGKQLSTEDFTTLLKQKLEGLSNYDDTDINNAITSLQNQLNTLLSGNADDAINSFNEIIAFLEGIEDSESLDNIIASIEQQIASKQDKITDIDSIRSGAAKGATALQSYTETDPIFKASAAYNITTNNITNWNDKISGDGTITKIVKVSSLPSSPDSNTLYIIV